jgi:hypothetical protein
MENHEKSIYKWMIWGFIAGKIIELLLVGFSS